MANGDLLQFKDSKNEHTKSMCLKEKMDEILSEIYKNTLTMGTSRDNFFGRIYNMYHDISKRQVQAFFDCQPSCQVHCYVCKRSGQTNSGEKDKCTLTNGHFCPKDGACKKWIQCCAYYHQLYGAHQCFLCHHFLIAPILSHFL